MEHDWKKITSHLYKNISPIKGELSSQIEGDFIYKYKINSIWIEFDMNEFIYLDPFYGEQESTSPFRMYVNPFQSDNRKGITYIQELENMTIEDSRINIKGAFSNSLHFSAPIIKFGEIDGDKIQFEMDYCLTNSASYAMMNGTIEDHSKSSGKIKIDLKINDMLILVSKKKNVKDILKHMNSKIYDMESLKEATDTNISYRDYDQFRISYKNLKHGINQKKPWWRII